MNKVFVLLMILGGWMPALAQDNASQRTDDARIFYVDSDIGDDENSGTSDDSPWQTLEKVSSIMFQPNDSVVFKRGSRYSGCVTIQGDGTSNQPITIGAYGEGEAPQFTNPDNRVCKGNAMRIRGDYHIIENLFFHHTAPAPPNSGFLDVWASGALHVELGYDHVIIRNNEFAHTAKAIQSYSEYSLITNNYIHDINESQQDGFLSPPYWGPIGIHLGIGNQEISYNIIENMYVEGGEWGGDGGAIEIDNGLNHKDNIYIHHNQTSHNMGFLEISWEHDIRQMPTNQIVIEHNVSRDFQSFVFWWAENTNSRISNNTIIRTDSVPGMATDTVFVLDGQDIVITKNIIVTSDSMWSPVFLGDEANSSIHSNNVYWDIDDGTVRLGIDPGEGEFTANPQFVDFDNGNYELAEQSTVEGYGAFADETSEIIKDLTRATNFEVVDDYDIPKDPILVTAPASGNWIKLEDDDPRLGVNGGDLWNEPRNSGGTTRTLWIEGNSISVLFDGTQIRFFGLKSDYMVTANIWIDGVLVAEDVPASGNDEFQALLWESDVLEYGVHTAELVSNGDTVEVDFIEFR